MNKTWEGFLPQVNCGFTLKPASVKYKYNLYSNVHLAPCFWLETILQWDAKRKHIGAAVSRPFNKEWCLVAEWSGTCQIDVVGFERLNDGSFPFELSSESRRDEDETVQTTVLKWAPLCSKQYK